MPLDRRRLHALLPVAASFLFLGFVHGYVVDFPNADDYNLFVAFRVKARAAATPGAWISALIDPHNEHVQIFPRLAATLLDRLLGRLRFDLFVMGGCLAVPLMVALLGARVAAGSATSSWLARWPSALLCINLSYAESLLWSAGGWQWIWVYALALVALFSFARGPVPLALLGVLGTAACRADGLLLPGAMALACAAGRRRGAAIAWASLSICLLLLQLSLVPRTRSPLELENAWQVPLYVVLMLGGAAGFGNAWISGACGAAVAIALPLLALRRPRLSLESIAFAAFVLLSTLAIAAARLPMGLPTAYLTGRYRLHSLFALAACYLLAHERAAGRGSPRRIEVAGSAGALLLALASVGFDLDQMRVRREVMEQDRLKWQLFRSLPHFDRERIMGLAATAGVYVPPEVPVEPWVSHALETPTARPAASIPQLHLRDLLVSDAWVLIDGVVVVPAERAGAAVSLTFATSRREERFSTVPRIRDTREPPRRWGEPTRILGFQALVDRRALSRARYAMSAVVEAPGWSAATPRQWLVLERDAPSSP